MSRERLFNEFHAGHVSLPKRFSDSSERLIDAIRHNPEHKRGLRSRK
jgi:hypothetical protein